MKFRTKLLLIFSATVAAAAGFTAGEAARSTRQEFSRIRRAESAALVAQFQLEFAQRGERVVYSLQSIADAESTLRMALDLSRPQSDPSVYAGDARGLAEARQLDFLELAGNDGAVISSTQGPERIGQKNEWVAQDADWNKEGAFLERVDSPAGADLDLLAVRTMHVGETNLYLIGGLRFDEGLLRTLAAPEEMRTLLYRNLDPGFAPADLASAEGTVEQAERFAPLMEAARSQPGQSAEQTIAWTPDPAGAETFAVLPLAGRKGDLLAVFLAGSTQRGLAAIESRIRGAALLAGASALLIGLLLSLWISARLTGPLERLTAAACEVASGHWDVRVKGEGRGDAGGLARAFNQMTQRLTLERERLSQAERVAAWRELARRLAFELKGPLFGLQITIENLARVREQNPEGFDEVFIGSMAALRAEFASLNGSIGRFNEFANMPALRPRRVSVNEIARAAIRSLEPRFNPTGRPPITPELHLDENVPEIQGDPELLRRALENLMASSCEAMATGGMLSVRTSQHGDFVRIEVSDSAGGLDPEEGGREIAAQPLAAPFAAKLNGTGLGLAVAQSVVSDHGGRITIESAAGAGTTYRIELPLELPASAPLARPTPPPALRQTLDAPGESLSAKAPEPTEQKTLEPSLRDV